MAIEIPTNEPEKINAGMTTKWKRSFSDYPAPTWTLTYKLFKAGKTETITAVADGSDHSVVLNKSDTVDWEAGYYHWIAWVDDPTERYEVDQGTVEVIVNFEKQTTGFDNRSDAQKMYEGISDLLTGKIERKDLDTIEYGISAAVGRNIKKMTIAELRIERVFWKSEWQKEKDAEKIANGKSTGRKVKVRFTK